jgi:hypothetical protein
VICSHFDPFIRPHIFYQGHFILGEALIHLEVALLMPTTASICDYLGMFSNLHFDTCNIVFPARTVEKQGPDNQEPKLEQPRVQAEAGVTTEHRSSSDEAAVSALANSSHQPGEISSEDIAESIAQASGVALADRELTPITNQAPNASPVTSSEDITEQQSRTMKS